MSVAEKILRMRLARGWTEYRLSEETGIKQSTISSWYRGKKSQPSSASLQKICGAFGITMAQLTAGEDLLVELTEEQKAMFEKWSACTPEQKELLMKLIDQLK